jgi:phospholipid-binding lipoprotein MlaA
MRFWNHKLRRPAGASIAFLAVAGILSQAVASAAIAEPAAADSELEVAAPYETPGRSGVVLARTDPSDALAASDALFEDDFAAALEEPAGDPLEAVNRKIFRGNRWLDRHVFIPVSRFYGWLIPDPAKRAVRGVFDNLNQPAIAVNHLLQREPKRAGGAGARFVVNTTVGLLGVWDPARRMGLEPHDADFGQTLGKAGVGSGPYLMLPVFGPSTSRDLVGSVVDMVMRPDTWLLPLGARLVVESTDGITRMEENLDSVSALERSSIDFYAALRSAYLQSREAMIREPNAMVLDPVAAAAVNPDPGHGGVGEATD